MCITELLSCIVEINTLQINYTLIKKNKEVKAGGLLNSFQRLYMCAKLLQSFPTLCNFMEPRVPPGSTVHWILQARILEWVAKLSSRESSRPRD